MADFYKYHGLGNDYLVIDPQKSDISLTKNNIKLICDRNYGVGSDGILYGPFFQDHDIHFKIFNPDGSEAEKSGNGIRIFAQYLIDENYCQVNKFSIFTLGGKVNIEVIDEAEHLLKVDMGTYSLLGSETIKLPDISFQATCVTVGNPHCVIIQNNISKELTEKYGHLIENHAMFPNRTNVQFVRIMDRKNIQIEIWERGAGYTLASGTSSCAAACAVYQQGLIDADVTVHMPGGQFKISIVKDHVHLTGHVAKIMQGMFAKDFLTLLME